MRDHQKKQVRRALLDAGVELIEKNGLETTTIEAITLLAGTAKGTFYNYFKTKHDLIYAAMMDRSHNWEKELDGIMLDYAATLDRLNEVFRRIVFEVEKHPELYWIWLKEGLRRVRSADRQRTPFAKIMERLFVAGQTIGDIRQDVDPAELALDVSGLFLVHVARARHIDDYQILNKTLPRTLEIYVRGAAILRAASSEGGKCIDE